MFDHNEVLTFILATFVAVFLQTHRSGMAAIKGIRLLLNGFYCLYAGLTLTILEDFFAERLLNAGEHLLYAASSVFLACWIWKFFRRENVKP